MHILESNNCVTMSGGDGEEKKKKKKESLPSDPLHSLSKPPKIASTLIYKGPVYLPS